MDSEKPKISFAEPFSWDGNDKPDATWRWEVAVRQNNPEAVHKLDRMSPKDLGIYYDARSNSFEQLSKTDTVQPNAIEDYAAVARALRDQNASAETKLKAAFALGRLHSLDNQPTSSNFPNSTRMIHEKALSYLLSK